MHKQIHTHAHAHAHTHTHTEYNNHSSQCCLITEQKKVLENLCTLCVISITVCGMKEMEGKRYNIYSI